MINTDKLGEVGKLSVCFYGDAIDVVKFAVLKTEKEPVPGVNMQSIANIILIAAVVLASTQNAQIT